MEIIFGKIGKKQDQLKIRCFASNLRIFHFKINKHQGLKIFLKSINLCTKSFVVRAIFLKLRFFPKSQFLNSRFICNISPNIINCIVGFFCEITHGKMMNDDFKKWCIHCFMTRAAWQRSPWCSFKFYKFSSLPPP